MKYLDKLEIVKAKMVCDDKHVFQWAMDFSGMHKDTTYDLLAYQVAGIMPEYLKSYLDTVQ